MEGIILQGIGSFYTVWDGQKKYVCKAQKKLRKSGTPVPGDRCHFVPGNGNEDGWIEEILQRKNFLVRPAVANIDVLALVVAPIPIADLNLIEKLVLYARISDIIPALIVNKIDMDSALYQKMKDEFHGTNLKIFGVSAEKKTGLDELRTYLEGKTVCFAGQSAVGKSSLLNNLFNIKLETGELSRKTERGRHTTRRAELMVLGNTMVIDTPGFSLLNTMQMNPEKVPEYYPEYFQFAHLCKFKPCMHDTEPGCAVRQAVKDGKMDEVRYQRYRALLLDVRENWKGRFN